MWLGQARAWLAAHGSDLTAISTAVGELGKAAKAHQPKLMEAALSRLLLAVGAADGDLPANAFGQDLRTVFAQYAAAAGMMFKGTVNGDQRTYAAGVTKLAAAVARFATITTRITKTR